LGAVADMYAALSCRGIQYVGDLYSDFVHLNHYGHEMFADVLEALLTERDVRIWKYGPAARKTKEGQRGHSAFFGCSASTHAVVYVY
jgi:hypothetical protein